MSSPKIELSLSLTVTKPNIISISDPKSADSLQLIGTITQTTSPFPKQPITLLTMYSILQTRGADAFQRRMLEEPTDITNEQIKISMRPRHMRVNLSGTGGEEDLRQREYFEFITVPPLGEGSAEVHFSLAPDHLLRFYTEEGSLEEILKQFKPGQKFKIEPLDTFIRWWTFGSLEDTLRDKKFTMWSLPDSLPIDRQPGADETDEINKSLEDYIDRKDLASIIRLWNLPGTPGPEEEKPPNVKKMRADGWVFGEPNDGLIMTCHDYESAVFEFTE